MPENASNIPLDDEDILDLTVVAEPGKEPGAAPQADGPPEPDDTGVNFGTDLDALLDSLGAVSSASAPAQPVAPPAPQAAPIADQTPVDHKVNPDEELAMPEMSDIDSLLAELGADIPAVPPPPAPAAVPEEDNPMPAAVAAAPAPAADPAPKPAASAPMPEFDGILAQARAAEAQKAAEKAQAAPAPAPPAAPVAEKPAAAPKVPAAEPPVAPVVSQAAAAPEGDDHDFMDEAGEGADDDLDLNELDALLDGILATAPETGSPAAAPAAVPEVIPVPDQAILPPGHSAEIAELAAKVQRLEEAVEVLENAEISEAMIEGVVDAKVEAKIVELFEPGSMVMDRILNEMRGMFSEGEFDETLEKMAAAAAAKVIREEIAALIQENG